jgi:hypothetical protein
MLANTPFCVRWKHWQSTWVDCHVILHKLFIFNYMQAYKGYPKGFLGHLVHEVRFNLRT